MLKHDTILRKVSKIILRVFPILAHEYVGLYRQERIHINKEYKSRALKSDCGYLTC